ncbi:hypothetical protein ACQZV8_13275 [Magnetococcales bacterium HHB-1]
MAETKIDLQIRPVQVEFTHQEQRIDVSLNQQAPGWPFGENPVRSLLDTLDTPIIVDTVVMPQRYRVVKWLFLLSDETSNLEVTGEIKAYRKGDDVFFSEYGIMGDTPALSYAVDLEIDGSNVHLLITNQQSNPITVRLCRIGIFN